MSALEELADYFAGEKSPRQRLDRLELVLSKMPHDYWMKPEVVAALEDIRADVAQRIARVRQDAE